MRNPNYKKSLILLEKINSLKTKKGDSISRLFEIDGHSFLQVYQQSIFSELKEMSEKDFAYKKQKHHHLTAHVILLLTLTSSLLSYTWGVISRKKVLVYAIDKINSPYKSDKRIEGIYTYLYKNNISFFECFHTIPDKNTILNAFRRKRMALYLEAIDYLFTLLWRPYKSRFSVKDIEDVDFSLLEEGERRIAEDIVRRYLRLRAKSLWRINALKFLLRRSSISHLIAIDDTRHYHELLIAAKKAGVHTSAVQHGHFTKYHVGWLDMGVSGNISIPVPDTFIVWSDYWEKELIRLNSYLKNTEIVVGRTQREVVQSYGKKRGAQIGILMPYETDVPKEEVKAYIDQLQKCPNIFLIFKTRADIPTKQQFDEYGLPPGSIKATSDLMEALGYTDVVVGVYSTFLYDVLAYEKPVGMLDTSMDYGQGMLDNHLVDEISIYRHNLCEQVAQIARTPKDVLEKRRKKVFSQHTPSLEDTLSNILIP